MDRRPIRPSKNGKYNMNFIDWNNEWERVCEVEKKIEDGDKISDEEEEARVKFNMDKEREKYGVGINLFPILKRIDTSKECYICLKQFRKSSKVRQLPCKHLFCESCLLPWLKTSSICPTCKARLKPDPDEIDES